MANIADQVDEFAREISTLGNMFCCLIDETPSTIHLSQESENSNVLVHFGIKPKHYTLRPLKHPLVTTRMKDIANLLDENERQRRQIRFNEGPLTNHPKDEIVPLGNLRQWLRDDVKTFLTFGREYSYVFKEAGRIKKLTEMVCNTLRREEFCFLHGQRFEYCTTIWEAASSMLLMQLVLLNEAFDRFSQHSTGVHLVSTKIWGCDAIDAIENDYKGLMNGVISNRSASFTRLQQTVEGCIGHLRPAYRSLA